MAKGFSSGDESADECSTTVQSAEGMTMQCVCIILTDTVHIYSEICLPCMMMCCYGMLARTPNACRVNTCPSDKCIMTNKVVTDEFTPLC